MRADDPRYTLQARVLVDEAFIRIVDARDVACNDRTHFFAVSARIMRRILVDVARARGSAKRGGDTCVARRLSISRETIHRWIQGDLDRDLRRRARARRAAAAGADQPRSLHADHRRAPGRESSLSPPRRGPRGGL
jgi:hypothetical protein